jgi:tRNA G10  N-methylase Trm11
VDKNGGNEAMMQSKRFQDPLEMIFPSELVLLPQVNEVYEVQLAYMETLTLGKDDIVDRGAYFAKVGDQFTRHYLLCEGQPLQVSGSSSLRLKTFFEANQFKTGYATHGLFPYRGKFHPQMIKALINIMDVRPGKDLVLDPMVGSGTTLIEASLMGVDSVGIDISPFCAFMARTKANAMTVNRDQLQGLIKLADVLFEHLASKSGNGYSPEQLAASFKNVADMPDMDDAIADIVLLAFLDSLGFARRRKKADAVDLFPEVLQKYCRSIDRVQSTVEREDWRLGSISALQGDARSIELPSSSVDAVIFSPPYSFAIDYLKNDAEQLAYLGFDPGKLRNDMVGLRMKGRKKVHAYFEDMRKVLQEIHKVLKPGKYCTIIVGSNSKQMARILRVEDVAIAGIEERLIEQALQMGFSLEEKIIRQITGIANSMRNEFILIFKKLPVKY